MLGCRDSPSPASDADAGSAQKRDGFDLEKCSPWESACLYARTSGAMLEDDFWRMNEVYAEIMGEHRPARSCIQAGALPRAALFEIEAVAFLG